MTVDWLMVARFCGSALAISFVCTVAGLVFAVARDGERIAGLLMAIALYGALVSAILGAALGLHLIWR